MRDEAGRVTKISASNGKTLEYAYDARGALTRFTKEDDKWRKFEYDKHGRVREMSDANGKRLRVERDERGKIRRIATIQKPQERLADLFSPRLANVSKNAGASFIKAGYNPTAKPLSKVSAQEFTDPNPLCSGAECWTDVGFGGVDVFGGSGSYGGGGGGGAATEIAFAVNMDGFEPGMGGGGIIETYKQCHEAQVMICQDNYNQAWNKSIAIAGVGLVVGGVSTLLGATAEGGIVTAAVAGGTSVSASTIAIVVGILTVLGLGAVAAIEYGDAIDNWNQCITVTAWENCKWNPGAPPTRPN